MKTTELKDWPKIRKIVRWALEEDIGSGDITSQYTVTEGLRAEAVVLAKQSAVVAGLDVARLVFKTVDKNIQLSPNLTDGNKVNPADVLAVVSGPVRGILTAERTALNFLGRMSGIATLTSKFVEAIGGTGAKVTDTRKTTPGNRILDKYAVRIGGGVNHRFGLYDMVLIKENHLKATGSITEAVRRAREALPRFRRQGIKIEVETKTLNEAKETSSLPVDRIMLDNMGLEQIAEAVKTIRDQNLEVEIEVSGNITLENIRQIAQTGVDFISIGRLTHSAPASDISLLVEKIE
jgi:nicotinate-nucleotide pyrophosphorylase (carboxylating)